MYIKAEKVVSESIDGTQIVFDTENGKFYMFEELESLIWNNLGLKSQAAKLLTARC
jgi:hypothetical protein